MHKYWITPPDLPVEMPQGVRDDIIEAKRILHQIGFPFDKWTFIAWVIDKEVIPDTVKFYESQGYVVRELNELESYDEFWEQQVEGYLVTRLGRAGDLLRFLVLNELGGMYMDNDVELRGWTDEWLYATEGLLF